MRRLLSLLLLLVEIATSSIYPTGHFDHVTEITDEDQFKSLVAEAITDEDSTLFAPAWNQATKAFASTIAAAAAAGGKSTQKLKFADVNLQAHSVGRGPPNNPGTGGWPTIRFFNQTTGKEGGDYNKKHDGMAMCEELGDLDRMVDYIEDYSGTKLCDATATDSCTEKEVTYITKMKALSKKELEQQLERAVKLSQTSMKEELKQWNFRRRRILKQLIAKGGGSVSEEL